jgi:hypothetical protein
MWEEEEGEWTRVQGDFCFVLGERMPKYVLKGARPPGLLADNWMGGKKAG